MQTHFPWGLVASIGCGNIVDKRKGFLGLERAETRFGYVLAVAEKRAWGSGGMLNVAFAQGFPVEQWQLASCGKNMGMGTWRVLADCAHMHGQHATTESTQGHSIL
jgi:hypothetical protein